MDGETVIGGVEPTLVRKMARRIAHIVGKIYHAPAKLSSRRSQSNQSNSQQALVQRLEMGAAALKHQRMIEENRIIAQALAGGNRTKFGEAVRRANSVAEKAKEKP